MKGQDGKKNLFLRPLHELTLQQRIIHALVTFGLPLTFLSLFFSSAIADWGGRILLAIIEGFVGSALLILTEQAYVAIKRRKNAKKT